MRSLRREAFLLGYPTTAASSSFVATSRRAPTEGWWSCALHPDVLGAERGDAYSPGFDRWAVEILAPRARRGSPALDGVATGIDGVSLGGLHSLEIGLCAPGKVFGVVGALQPCVRGRIDRRSPATSPLRRVRRSGCACDLPRRRVPPRRLGLDAAMRARGIAHDLRVVAGPHDYVFNRDQAGSRCRPSRPALRGLAQQRVEGLPAGWPPLQPMRGPARPSSPRRARRSCRRACR